MPARSTGSSRAESVSASSPPSGERREPLARSSTRRPASVADLPRATLSASWQAIHGRPPPKGISRRLLEYAAAYAAQAKMYGGLDPANWRKLLKLADGNKTQKPATPRCGDTMVLSRGSRLVREWRGRTHAVEVADGGFLYDGKRYRSLSEIARAITGTRWSGPVFFGLKHRRVR